MADEGGVSGAYTDALTQASAQSKSDALVSTRTLRNLRTIMPWAMLASGLLGGLALAMMVWRRRGR